MTNSSPQTLYPDAGPVAEIPSTLKLIDSLPLNAQLAKNSHFCASLKRRRLHIL